MSTVIRLSEVSLCYRLARQRIPSFKEYAIHWLKGALAYRELWALKGIDLEIARGEVVGIVGRNGAGKTTLLKVICRVLEATTGTVEVAGEVAPILELGAGFDFELTGDENLDLNALLLGRTYREIREKRDNIVAFSELGDFIQSPVRNYSSGMLARLGFSIATAWDPDILILDEVLAVGDLSFAHKCERRIKQLRSDGATVLMVSHSPKAILESCDRAIWLDQGKLMADGEPKAILDRYTSTIQD